MKIRLDQNTYSLIITDPESDQPINYQQFIELAYTTLGFSPKQKPPQVRRFYFNGQEIRPDNFCDIAPLLTAGSELSVVQLQQQNTLCDFAQPPSKPIAEIMQDRLLKWVPEKMTILYNVPHIAMRESDSCWQSATEMLYSFFKIPFPETDYPEKFNGDIFGLGSGSDQGVNERHHREIYHLQCRYEKTEFIPQELQISIPSIYQLLLNHGPFYIACDKDPDFDSGILIREKQAAVVVGIEDGMLLINNPFPDHIVRHPALFFYFFELIPENLLLAAKIIFTYYHCMPQSLKEKLPKSFQARSWKLSPLEAREFIEFLDKNSEEIIASCSRIKIPLERLRDVLDAIETLSMDFVIKNHHTKPAEVESLNPFRKISIYNIACVLEKNGKSCVVLLIAELQNRLSEHSLTENQYQSVLEYIASVFPNDQALQKLIQDAAISPINMQTSTDPIKKMFSAGRAMYESLTKTTTPPPSIPTTQDAFHNSSTSRSSSPLLPSKAGMFKPISTTMQTQQLTAASPINNNNANDGNETLLKNETKESEQREYRYCVLL